MEEHKKIDEQSEVDRLFEERMERLAQMAPPPPISDPFIKRKRKSKVLAGLLAFFVPGTGHFYLGLMQRGLFVMLALIIDIYAIVHTATMNPGSVNVPLITLFGLLVPAIYFYNIFDALQSTDAVNSAEEDGFLGGLSGFQPSARTGSNSTQGQGRLKGANLGWLLVAGGCIVLLVSNKPDWMSQLLNSIGSYIGAGVLIGAGAYLFLKGRKSS
jgi:hypothetical protein